MPRITSTFPVPRASRLERAPDKTRLQLISGTQKSKNDSGSRNIPPLSWLILPIEAVRAGGRVTSEFIRSLVASGEFVVLASNAAVGASLQKQKPTALEAPKTIDLAVTPPRPFGLTPREIEVVHAVASGASNREIGKLLNVSQHTVKHHLTSIFDKTGVSTRIELLISANHHKI
jgi:two-component system, NarL family, nitrate/nitrite response regulator NarL